MPCCRLFLIATALLAAAPLGSEPLTDHPDLSTVLRSMTGEWEGVLEYRHYQTDDRVELPATRVAETSRLGPHLLQDLRFTDPGATMRSMQIVSIDDANDAVGIMMPSPDGMQRETYELIDVEIRDAMSDWTVVLERTGADDHRPADLRLTQELRGGVLRSRKEVRFHDDPAGGWEFRNETRFERVKADPAALVGTWTVDLRPTPDALPFLKQLRIDAVENGRIRGAFYDSPIRDGHVNVHWGAVHFAFITEDGTGAYHTSGVLRGDTIEATTLSIGRDFLSVWYARQP